MAPIPGVTPGFLEDHRARLAADEAEFMARNSWAAASYAASVASAAAVPLSPPAGTAAEPSLAASATCGVAEDAGGTSQHDPERDRIANAHADRRALIHSLFRILDRDGDGVLSAAELFVCARAVARNSHNDSPMPPDADTPQSPGWLEVYQALAAAHADPSTGVDCAAFSRIITEGTHGPTLSNRAIVDLRFAGAGA